MSTTHLTVGKMASVIVVTALAVVSTAAHAQFARSAFSNLLEPDVMRRDVSIFAEELSLDQSQRVIFEVLIADYEEAVRARMQELRDTVSEVRPQISPEQREAMREQRQAFRERFQDEMQKIRQEVEDAGLEMNSPEAREIFRERLEAVRDEMPRREDMQQFMPDEREMTRMFAVLGETIEQWQGEKEDLLEELYIDLKVQLTDAQLERWPSVERTLRREKSLDAGQLSGERVDLFIIVQEMGLSPAERDTIADLLDHYAIELDEALQRRNAVVEQNQTAMFEVLQTRDMDAGLKMFDEEYRQRTSVRNVNETYVELIKTALGGERGDAFEQRYLERGYQRIFAPTRTQRIFNAALELPDLAPEFGDAVAELQAAYLAELAAANEQLVRTVRRHEADRMRHNIERMASRFLGGDAPDRDDPIGEAFEQRNELDERYIESLRSALPEEAFEALPTGRQRGRGGWGGQRDGRGGDGPPRRRGGGFQRDG